MKFAEIIDGLSEGKRYRRTSWWPTMKYIEHHIGETKFFITTNCCWHEYVLKPSDLFADDWEEAK